jgi:hypothetical protein
MLFRLSIIILLLVSWAVANTTAYFTCSQEGSRNGVLTSPAMLVAHTNAQSHMHTATCCSAAARRKERGRTTPWTKQPCLHEVVRSRVARCPSHFYLILPRGSLQSLHVWTSQKGDTLEDDLAPIRAVYLGKSTLLKDVLHNVHTLAF